MNLRLITLGSKPKLFVESSGLISILASIAPSIPDDVAEAEAFLKRIRFPQGSDDELDVRFLYEIAKGLHWRFPAICRESVYQLLRVHSDGQGKSIPFKILRMVSEMWPDGRATSSSRGNVR